MKSLHILFQLAFWLLALSIKPVVAADWKVDSGRSRVGFAYQAMGSDIQGEFNRYAANIQYDPANPGATQVKMNIDAASIDAGLPDATSEALSANFLDARRFPNAVFVSSTVKALGQNRYQINGELTLKGQRRPLSLTALLKPENHAQNPGLRMTGTFQLKRLDYGIGAGMWSDVETLKNEVRVAFSLLLIPSVANRK